MAVTALGAAEAGRPPPRVRLLEDERWLAMVLLAPTAVLLGLFIAYPFAMGVVLSFSDAKVGDPGHFVGFANFVKLWSGRHLLDVGLGIPSGTRASRPWFKLGLGLWLAMLLNRHFKGKAIVRAFILLPFIIPTVLSTFAWKWMFDPTFSVINWSLFKLGLIHARINWLGDPDPRHGLDHRGQHLARRAVLRNQPAGRAADHQPRAERGPPRSTARGRGRASG